MEGDTESVSSSGVDGGSSIITNDSGGGGRGSSGSGGSLPPPEAGPASRTEPVFITVRIRIPDLNVENTLQFQNHQLIWDVKQQCLAAIPKELQESFNYGLFYPPSNGKAGKFLDEERRLSEYPFQGPVGYLELKYKRRVYKMLQMDEKQLKNINSRANHKKIVDYINSSNIEKVNKMLTKGLDPNFHCHDSGETPLCLAAGIKGKSSRMIIALINGGAILDFRTKDGTTALHRAVTKNNSESVKTLLDLGASPNYKDGRGLTPLYHAVASSSDVNLVEMLLHDHAIVGVQDRQEWHEVHHACRNGLIQHLEHLLFYSADINARNASGNTPLHVCAVNNQESCARILLFRGCETEALNFAGQTPYQVAVIAGNLELAEIIRNHRAEDIVPFKNAPKFNPRRRTSASSTLSRTASDASMCQTNTTTTMSTIPYQPRMESPLVNSLRTGSINNKPPSPSPSDRSLPPFSSGGSSVSETTSTGSGASSVQHQEDNHEVEDEQLDSASTLAASMANALDPRCDSVSLSSGVGTSSQSGSSGSAATPTSEPPKATVLHSGIHVVCVETYVSSEEGSLKINAGDIIQVTGSTDDGRLEGIIRGQSGYFPASCAQEVRLRNPDAVHSPPITSTPAPGSRVLGRRELRENRPYQPSNNRFMGLEPRTAILHKGKKGFGFVLRGAKAASPLMEIIPSEKCPGLQYMDDVDPEGVADLAGIKKGDFLIAINGDDVTQASHETVVNLIRKSGDSVALTIVTINVDHIREMEYSNGGSPASISKARAYSTLPRKMQGRSMVAPPPPPKRDPSTTLSVGRAKARSMVANLAALEVLDRAINEHDYNSTENKSNLELLPSSSPKISSPTIAAITSQTHKKSPSNSQKSSPVKTTDETPIYQQSGKYDSKNGTVLRKDFYSTPALNGQVDNKKDVAIDVVERKIHSQEDINKATLSHDIVDSNKTIDDEEKGGGGTHGYFTLPSKTKQKKSLELHDGYRTLTKIRPVATTAKPMVINTSPTLPPPEHPPPPPPPPSTQVVKVDSNIPNSPPSDYAKVERKMVPTSPPASTESPLSPTSGVMSSFKPSDNAKLYASPESIHALGYRIPQKHGGSPLNGPIHDPINGITSVQVTKQKKSPTRANSMPPRPKPLLVRKMEQQISDITSNALPPPPPPALQQQQQQTSPPPSTPPPPPPPVDGQAMETYKVNGVKYTTYTTFRSPLTPDDNQFEGATPDIPEPDYSDPENDQHRRASTTTLEKKKKKSVSFVIDEGDSAKQVSGKPSKVESILKDPNKNNNNSDGNYHYHHHNYSRASSYDSDVMSASYSEVYSRNSSTMSDKKVVTKQSKVKPSVASDESNKVRIDVSNNRLTKSQSFCSDKSSSPNETAKSPPKKSLPASPAATVVSSSPQCQNSGGGISVHDIKTARSQLKPSRSFPNDFSVTNNSTPTQTEDGGDNSSSGVSSDQEVVISTKTDNDKYVTYLPVEGPSTTNSVKPSSNKPLHPTQMISSQVWENDSESSDDVSDKSWVLRAEKDSSTGHNIISMKKMLHPKLAALFDVPNASGAGTRTLPNLKHHHHHVNIMEARHHLTDHPETNSRVLSRSSPPTKQKSLQAFNNRSIEESLALIQQHVSNLGDSNSNIALSGDLPLGVPPPPSKTEIVVPEVLAPPPGFSDSDSNYSDNDTLSAEQKSLRKKYGKAVVLKKERGVMSRSMDYGQHISSSSAMDYSTLPRSHHAPHFNFKSKNLGNWTVSDVCEWLDSLFMSEYKTAFLQNRIDGRRLMTITKADLEKLGVHRVGHMLNIEKSLKKFAASIHHHHHQRK